MERNAKGENRGEEAERLARETKMREVELKTALHRAIGVIVELNGGVPPHPCSDCRTEKKFDKKATCSPHGIERVVKDLWKVLTKRSPQ